ncbi:hypothetical protein ABZ413_28340 [Nocardia rhamnosiphila]|uniref:hypothetical protein n=1 Tax=Nocardia rhamnosiphila TaxID=426716 RepID=UPI00340C8793
MEDAGHLYPEVAPPTVRMALHVTSLRYSVDDEQFELVGTFDADGVAEAAVMGADWITYSVKLRATAHSQ